MERTPSPSITRRRALAVLGAGTAVGSLPGVSATEVDPIVPPDPPVDFEKYPYGHDEADVEAAKRVMEEAGYGPDNRFTLDWIQYKSPAWKTWTETIGDRLEDAYVDVEVDQTFDPFTRRLEEGNTDAYVLGWIGEYPGPRNYLKLLDPPNTVRSADSTADGAYVFWSDEAKGDPEVRAFARKQFETLANNPGTTQEARRRRAAAAVAMEEANWEEVALLPIRHGTNEYYWHDWADFEVPGTMGGSRASTSDTVSAVEGRDRLPLTSETITSLDPVAARDDPSLSVVTDLYEGLLEYPNGKTEVETALAADFSVSDDLTTYTFELKEGIEFHDGTELTAADAVYSFRRLLESPNSKNGRLATEVLGLVHETEVVENDRGDRTERVVPGSLGVTATGTYELEIELEEPLTHAPSLLAYPAFSIVPEGIVGDIEGYDGTFGYKEFATANPVGTGPFEFVEWEQGNEGRVVLDAFDGYHGKSPGYEGIDARILTSNDVSFERFLDGEAAVGTVPTSKFSKDEVNLERTDERGRRIGTYGPLENGQTVNYANVPGLSTFYVGFNVEKVPKPVRQAVAYVANQDDFVRNQLDGRSLPAYHLMPPQVFPGGADAYEKHYEPGSDVGFGTTPASTTVRSTDSEASTTGTGSSNSGTTTDPRTGTGTDGGTGSQGMPGFGIGAALTVLGGGALLQRLREEDG